VDGGDQKEKNRETNTNNHDNLNDQAPLPKDPKANEEETIKLESLFELLGDVFNQDKPFYRVSSTSYTSYNPSSFSFGSSQYYQPHSQFQSSSSHKPPYYSDAPPSYEEATRSDYQFGRDTIHQSDREYKLRMEREKEEKRREKEREIERWRNKELWQVIEYFIFCDGLNVIGETVLRKQNPSVSFQSILPLLRTFIQVQNYFKSFEPQETITQSVKTILSSINTLLTGLSDKEFKNTNKTVSNEFLESFESFSYSFLSGDEAPEFIERFQLEFYRKSLASSSFEKKLYGLNGITTLLSLAVRKDGFGPATSSSSSSFSTYPSSSFSSRMRPSTASHSVMRHSEVRWLDAEFILSWLHSAKVFEEIFEKSLNVELLKRSAELFKLLAQKSLLSHVHLDLWWNSSLGKQETIRVAIYRVVNELIGQMTIEQLQYFEQKIVSLRPLSLYDFHLLSLLKDITVALSFHTPENNLLGLELFWKLVHQQEGEEDEGSKSPERDTEPQSAEEREKEIERQAEREVEKETDFGVSDEIIAEALKHLNEMFQRPIQNDTLRIRFLSRCLSNIQKHHSVVRSLQLIQIILQTYTQRMPSQFMNESAPTILSMTEKLATDHKIIESLLLDFVYFNQITEKKLKFLDQKFQINDNNINPTNNINSSTGETLSSASLSSTLSSSSLSSLSSTSVNSLSVNVNSILSATFSKELARLKEEYLKQIISRLDFLYYILHITYSSFSSSSLPSHSFSTPSYPSSRSPSHSPRNPFVYTNSGSNTYNSNSSVVYLTIDNVNSLWGSLFDGKICNEQREVCYNWFQRLCEETPPSHSMAVKTNEYIFVEKLSKVCFNSMNPSAFQCFERYFSFINQIEKNLEVYQFDEIYVLDLDSLKGLSSLWEIIFQVNDELVLKTAIHYLIDLYDCISPQSKLGINQVRERFIDRVLSHLRSSVSTNCLSAIDRCLLLLTWYIQRYESKYPQRYKKQNTEENNFYHQIKQNNLSGRGEVIRLVLKKTDAPSCSLSQRTYFNYHVSSSLSQSSTSSSSSGKSVMHSQGHLPRDHSIVLSVYITDSLRKVRQLLAEKLSLSEREINIECGSSLRQSYDQSVQALQLKDTDTLYYQIKTGSLMSSHRSPPQLEDPGTSPVGIIARNQDHFDLIFDLLNLDHHDLTRKVSELLQYLPLNPQILKEFQKLEAGISEKWDKLLPSQSPYNLLNALETINAIIENTPSDQQDEWKRKFISVGGLKRLYQIFMSDNNSNASHMLVENSSQITGRSLELLLRILNLFFLRVKRMTILELFRKKSPKN